MTNSYDTAPVTLRYEGNAIALAIYDEVAYLDVNQVQDLRDQLAELHEDMIRTEVAKLRMAKDDEAQAIDMDDRPQTGAGHKF